jgi:hypothetical protein
MADKVNIGHKNRIGRLFCRHTYQWFQKPVEGPFHCISGEEEIEVCTKCGKQNDTYYRYYK